MASIQKYSTKNGTRWRVQYRDPHGKSRTKSGFLRKTNAQAWAAKNTAALIDGDWITPEAQVKTVEDFWPSWWATKQDLTPGSLLVMEPAWRNHVQPAWGARKVGSIRRSEVQAWLTGFADHPVVGRRAYGILAGILDVAVEDGALRRNDIRGLRLPRKPEPKKVFLTPEQVWALIEECSQMREAVALCALAGMRWGETVGLQPRDLQPDKNRISISRAVKDHHRNISVGGLKGHEKRVVSVPGFLMQRLVMLSARLEPYDFIFRRKSGKLWGQLGRNDFFAQAVGRLVARGVLEQRVTIHGLRHVAAGLLVQAGASVKVVQRQLGHKSAAMTLDTYAELFDGELDQVGVAMGEVFSGVVKLSWDGVPFRCMGG